VPLEHTHEMQCFLGSFYSCIYDQTGCTWMMMIMMMMVGYILIDEVRSKANVHDRRRGNQRCDVHV